MPCIYQHGLPLVNCFLKPNCIFPNVSACLCYLCLFAAESEFRDLSEAELAHLKTAALPGDIRVRDMDAAVLRNLYRRGLVYWEVPIGPEDRFMIPPLEGFVSNKTTESGDNAADPLEALLYSVFVASSTRTRVADLATILNTGVYTGVCYGSLLCASWGKQGLKVMLMTLDSSCGFALCCMPACGAGEWLAYSLDTCTCMSTTLARGLAGG